MTAPARSQFRPGLRLGRRSLHQLRSALERDAGQQAAAYLQEAGFAGGEEVFAEFSEWLLGTRGVEHPGDLDAAFLTEVLAEFFSEQGWGTLSVTRLGPAMLALDAPDWAEAEDDGRSEFPTCHLSSGLLADFVGRLAGGLIAVMEVECRSRGEARCRFVAGAPDTLGALYDRMSQGAGYQEAVGSEAASV